ncbi:hypothetical protein [Methylobacterium aquaticum]|uniref:Uncharacterized protein n=1 Tax=Methylobacterium aquaticum TaxID=270351 RepID=A0A0C6G2L0_9HYPH|nr:hypothetical protein [Methylobacterium aquaticum]BAQ50385.1 hypothetical protein Maq22A_4p60145 [Methylobacterium aquaticum]
MSTPAKPIPLGRAPRPRTNPEDLAQLVAGGAEAGFARPLAPAPEPASEPMPALPAAEAETPAAAPARKMGKGAPVNPLRLEVPKAVWLELKMEAAKREVSVKFLVLEALAAKGYSVDLDEVPEDGRRGTKR